MPPAIEWAYNPDAQSYPYDPEKAKQLLADAGYPDGFETTFWVTESGSGMQSPKTMAEAIQADLQASASRPTSRLTEWGAYSACTTGGMGDKAGLAEMSWMFDTGDPHTVLPLNFSSEGDSPKGFNTGRYNNKRVDELINKRRNRYDQEERGKLYKEVQQITSEEAPWIFVDNAKQNAATLANVKGFALSPSFLLSFKDTSVEGLSETLRRERVPNQVVMLNGVKHLDSGNSCSKSRDASASRQSRDMEDASFGAERGILAHQNECAQEPRSFTSFSMTRLPCHGTWHNTRTHDRITT